MDELSEPKVNGHIAPHPCPECGKVVKGGGGLYAHLLLAHNIRRPNQATFYRQETERLQADAVWKEQEITNLKASVAKLSQDVEHHKRLMWAPECLACGHTVDSFHHLIMATDQHGKNVGTVFVCGLK